MNGTRKDRGEEYSTFGENQWARTRVRGNGAGISPSLLALQARGDSLPEDTTTRAMTLVVQFNPGSRCGKV